MGHQGVVQAILTAGADTSVSTPYGWTAMKFAKAREQEAVATMLKAAGAVDGKRVSGTAAPST
jgi:hypothetical protein